MDTGDSVLSSDNIGGSVVGNNLTSDILRARAKQYYNNCHPHVPRSSYQSNAIHKCGSMTHINGFVNGVKTPTKHEQNSCQQVTPSKYQVPLRYRSDRPHRAHSERSNKSPSENLNYMVANNGISNAKVGLYRSNSSLDLDHSQEILEERSGMLRRDYGSASSLDLISATGESFFAMLREFRRDNFDQRSPGPARIQEFLKGKLDPTPSSQNASNTLANGPESFEDSNSPKLKTKFHKLWDIKDRNKMKSKMLSSEPSIFKKLRGSKTDMADCTGKGSDNSLDAEARIEDKMRRKAFAHYDCDSVVANLSYASRLRSLLSKRRNTTTGASAASMQNRSQSNLENLNPEETDPGDGQSSELLLSCPFFRNELGGEEERVISLNRTTCKKQKPPDDAFGVSPTTHKPNIAYGVSVLEKSGVSRWNQRFCPYQRQPLQMEKTGAGALYYRLYFYGQEHQNWFGNDENLGPVAISIKREKMEHTDNSAKNSTGIVTHYQYRLIIRTSELLTMRGTVLEESVPTIARSNQPRLCHAKEVIEYIAPELHLPCLRLAVAGPQTEERLVRLDEQGLTKTFKIGVMYCKAGQGTEEEMYNNEFAGPAFEEFLDMLGQRIRLKGFEKYRGGLDTKTDTTGLYSVFTSHQDCEVMFHVSTLLPYTPNNKQQLLRKRHIGNDIVTIVFQEPDALPFTPKNIRSQFQHVFIVIRAVNPCSENTCYRVAVSRSKEVPAFGPPISAGAVYSKSKKFADFLLAKVINAENAAHRSDKFVTMAQRTRQEYLKDLATNYCSNTTVDSGPKFSAILSFGGRKKERCRPRFIPDRYVLGAISWQIQVEDFSKSTVIDCLLAISVDTLIVMDENTHEIIFVCPCASILGWSSQTTSLKVFYHQGECLVIRSKDPDVDEIQEIVSRLQAVTNGAETQELILRRNSLGQLGFHVQFEGVITEVETYGFAWQAGLRQGSRLVEICKVAVATLSYDQMVDLLKTSMTVSVTVIPSLPNERPRKGCNLHNCSYLSAGSIGDYENIDICDHGESHHKTATPRQQSAFHSQRISSRRENHSNSHPNRSPSMDRILPKPDVRTIFADTRRDHMQHHSILSLRNIQDSSQNILPSRLAAYAGVGSLSSMDREGSPKSGGFPTPRTSPVYLSNSHDHGLPTYGNIQSHLHRSFHDRNRNGISQRLTHIGGLVSARSELSLTDVNPFHMRTHSHQKISVCPHSSSKSQSPSENSCIQQRSHQNSPQSPPSKQGNSFNKRSPSSVNSDYHSDSSSDWHQGASSADELCDSRISSSPHRHIPDSKSPQSLPSRNISESTQSKLSRLRPGVTNCHSRPSKPTVNFVAIASSGSSCSGSTSTLQEDLFKLINPEYLDSDSNSEDPPSSHLDSDTGSRTHLSTPSSSLERSAGNTPDPALDVILTKAQPAHIISSEPSSPAAADNRLERLSPRVLTDRVSNKFKPLPPPPSSPTLLSLTDSRDIDWTSLVSSATKGIDGLPNGNSWLEEAEKQLGLESNSLSTNMPNVKDLEARLMKMQNDLLKEQHQKANLENEVLQLREENQRLHEESQTAAVQIRKYKEWLYHTRETQS